jgi:hypothetical protein
VATAGSLAVAASAQAAEQTTVTAGQSVARECQAAPALGKRAVDGLRYTAEASGLVRARLSGRAGDWDVAVFDARSGERVAASAAFRSNELAESFVRRGQRLVVQACRVRGGAGEARLSVDTIALKRGSGEKSSLVSVKATREQAGRLEALGLDLTEHGHEGQMDVVAHGRADLEKLRRAGFSYEVEVADLAAQARAHRRADARYARRAARAAQATPTLPSGRTTYRRLSDYETELKQLAMEYPALVRPITLNRKTLEGRDVVGIEITRNPNAVEDGKPIHLNMATHHAREWPAAEHSMELAYDLLRGYGRSARTTDLVDATRTIVIPVINPDGFNVSREANPGDPEDDFDADDLEMRRKNCRIRDGSPGTEDCSALLRTVGVDPNRNYGGFWGGPGASFNPRSDIYRGEGPFSEPEVQNVRELLSTRNVTTLLTNHTYGDLWLRPPGVAATGFSVDEELYRELGRRATEANGYANIPSFALYDTTGTTEDWSYWTQGSLGFTPEIGTEGFHPPYEVAVVGEYLGVEPARGAGRGGNREAFLRMLEATADRETHSLIRGRAPRGSRLTISKAFETSTSPVLRPNPEDPTTPLVTEPITFPDRLEYSLTTQRRNFRWAVTPSTRPVVAGRYGREPTGAPQPEITFANPEGVPEENTEDENTPPYEEIPFTIQGAPYDNGSVTVHIEWTSPATDWDIYVFDADGNRVGSSAQGNTREENATILFPEPGEYTVRVFNYDQVDGAPVDDWTNGRITFGPPTPPVPGVKESWTLTCERPDGSATRPQQVEVDRGERVDVGNACRLAR